jgi:hypothetical protein
MDGGIASIDKGLNLSRSIFVALLGGAFAGALEGSVVT